MFKRTYGMVVFIIVIFAISTNVDLISAKSPKSASYWQEYGEQMGQYYAQMGQEMGEYYARKYGNDYDADEYIPKHKKSRKYRTDQGFFSKGKKNRKEVYNGGGNFKNHTFDKAIINGPAQLKQCSIKRSLTVNGPVIASGLQGSSAASLTVSGTLDGDNLNIPFVMVNGYLELSNSTIDELKISTNKAYIENSQISRIKVNDKKSRPATLKLIGSTTVKEIAFASGQGTVIADSSVSINLSKLSGGSVKRAKK